MNSRYPRKLRPWLNLEIARLKAGSKEEIQRFRKILVAMNKATLDPLNHEYKKDLPENYKAADVLQQYRLFFKIIPAAEAKDFGTDTLYFVWINDEESLHRNNDPDDCYAVFRKMLERKEIEPYPITEPTPSVTFSLKGSWGSQTIYADLIRKGTGDHACTYLILNKHSESEYRIDYVTVSEEDIGLATSLLTHLCEAVDQRKISLVYELGTNENHIKKSQHLLEKFSFVLTDTIDDQEIWVRQSKMTKP